MLVTEQRASTPGFPRYEILPWLEHGLIAGITGAEQGFNVGLNTAEPAAAVMDRWRSLSAAFQPGFASLQLGLQVHGTTIARHTTASPGLAIRPATDGHVTTLPGVMLAVTVADCVPIYLAHPATRTIGLLHAGWRGIAAGLLEQGIEAISRLTACPATEIIIHCGVAICGECYEVGPEVQTALGLPPKAAAHIDLRAMLARRARGAGVTRISHSTWCTAHDDGRFFSHRRSAGGAGRMAAYLGAPDA